MDIPSYFIACLFISTFVYKCYGQDNIALDKTTIMKDNFYNGDDQAVDGCIASSNACCSRTTGFGWWAIDLGAIYDVDRLVVTNGNAATHISAEYLGNFQVLSLTAFPAQWSSLSGVQCGEYSALVPQDQSVTVTCQVSTQYLAIKQDAALFLCEVEIYEAAPPAGPDIISVTPSVEIFPPVTSTVTDVSRLVTMYKHRRLDIPPINIIRTSILLDCASECIQNQQCVRVNFNAAQSICEELDGSVNGGGAWDSVLNADDEWLFLTSG